MVTIDDIREELNDDSLTDTRIQKVIDRTTEYIKTYTNNPNLPESMELDDVVIYLVCRKLSPDTRNGVSAGKSSESVNGVSFSFLNDLPLEIKMVLMKYKMVTVYE